MYKPISITLSPSLISSHHTLPIITIQMTFIEAIVAPTVQQLIATMPWLAYPPVLLCDVCYHNYEAWAEKLVQHLLLQHTNANSNANEDTDTRSTAETDRPPSPPPSPPSPAPSPAPSRRSPGSGSRSGSGSGSGIGSGSGSGKGPAMPPRVVDEVRERTRHFGESLRRGCGIPL